MYALIYANFVYTQAVAGRKRIGIVQVYEAGAYTVLGDSYSYIERTQNLISANCTAYGHIQKGDYIVAFSHGSDGDTVSHEGTYMFVFQL